MPKYAPAAMFFEVAMIRFQKHLTYYMALYHFSQPFVLLSSIFQLLQIIFIKTEFKVHKYLAFKTCTGCIHHTQPKICYQFCTLKFAGIFLRNTNSNDISLIVVNVCVYFGIYGWYFLFQTLAYTRTTRLVYSMARSYYVHIWAIEIFSINNNDVILPIMPVDNTSP